MEWYCPLGDIPEHFSWRDCTKVAPPWKREKRKGENILDGNLWWCQETATPGYLIPGMGYVRVQDGEQGFQKVRVRLWWAYGWISEMVVKRKAVETDLVAVHVGLSWAGGLGGDGFQRAWWGWVERGWWQVRWDRVMMWGQLCVQVEGVVAVTVAEWLEEQVIRKRELRNPKNFGKRWMWFWLC